MQVLCAHVSPYEMQKTHNYDIFTALYIKLISFMRISCNQTFRYDGLWQTGTKPRYDAHLMDREGRVWRHTEVSGTFVSFYRELKRKATLRNQITPVES
jgi:hypothetical protein